MTRLHSGKYFVLNSDLLELLLERLSAAVQFQKLCSRLRRRHNGHDSQSRLVNSREREAFYAIRILFRVPIRDDFEFCFCCPCLRARRPENFGRAQTKDKRNNLKNGFTLLKGYYIYK